MPVKQQVAVELGVEVGDPVGDVQQGDDVLEQSALIGMVVLDAGRGRRELADELVVDQEALDQGAEVRVAHPEQHLAQPGHQLGDVLRALRQEILGLDLRGIDDLEVGEDDLERPLEDLGLAPDVQEVARLERPGQALGRVPEPRADGARLVAQLEVADRDCPGDWPGAACRRPETPRRPNRR